MKFSKVFKFVDSWRVKRGTRLAQSRTARSFSSAEPRFSTQDG